MLCCGDCHLETETTITAVIILDSNDRKKQKLKQWTEKVVKRKPSLNETIDLNASYRNEHLLNPNKENFTQNIESDFSKTKRRISHSNIVIDESMVSQGSGMETGRFNPIQNRNNWLDESQTKRNLDSKTTSFGSLASRRSSAAFYKEREMEILHGELDKLKEEEMRLRKDKLEKEYLYQREIFKINHMRDQLRTKSKERYSDLTELKELFTNHKRNKK